MADDYDYDGDDMFGFEDDWLYVEDEFALADELAETQIADPGYAGTNHEVDMESYEYDLFGYWDDLEYADDTYWDYDAGHQPGQGTEKAGQKRKRGAPAMVGGTDKRRKVSGTHAATVSGLEASQPESVVFMSREQRNRLAGRPAPTLTNRIAVSFLPDWKERFADKDGVVSVESMPADMQLAAEAEEDDTPHKARAGHTDAMLVGNEEGGDWEDEDAGEELGEQDQAENALAGLDPDMLKMILKQKLGEAGLEGIDESAFIDTLNKMLAGDEDEAAGDLANSLLGQATAQGGNTALSGWLSQQGVSMDAAEEDDASSVATAELSEGSGRAGQSMQVSPPDSAISVPETKQMALHPGSPTSTQKEMPATTRLQKKKSGKRVTFDVPPSSEEDTQQDGIAKSEQQEVLAPPRSEDSWMSEPTVVIPIARATGSKSIATGKRPQPDAQLQEELDESLKAGKSTTAEAAESNVRQTRKRKAAVEDAEGGGEAGGGKPRAVKEAATRKTRSARAKAGAK
ncbi:hypothetical protein LTR36_004002 [Oleoguttula mirabilis]|uniref:Uncharacterized protein n=1 Tax=Oleoguttula mirabilis TaxID=1507867 RepID=A0AAV9JJS0_9PEZI|nr:hypothetical protein LTR36_004002 [Oleoguttula mirabilis]